MLSNKKQSGSIVLVPGSKPHGWLLEVKGRKKGDWKLKAPEGLRLGKGSRDGCHWPRAFVSGLVAAPPANQQTTALSAGKSGSKSCQQPSTQRPVKQPRSERFRPSPDRVPTGYLHLHGNSRPHLTPSTSTATALPAHLHHYFPRLVNPFIPSPLVSQTFLHEKKVSEIQTGRSSTALAVVPPY